MYHPTLARRLWTRFQKFSPVSLAWIGGINCGKSPFREREPSSISVIEELEVVCKTIWR